MESLVTCSSFNHTNHQSINRRIYHTTTSDRHRSSAPLSPYLPSMRYTQFTYLASLLVGIRRTSVQRREPVRRTNRTGDDHDVRCTSVRPPSFLPATQTTVILTFSSIPTNSDLLSVILSVLTTRLTQGYPYTLKSLDILLHLLHAHRLPHPAFFPPCRALYGPIIALASPSQSAAGGKGGPGLGDAYVMAIADEFLVGVGYDVRFSDAWVGGRGDGGSALWCETPWMGNGSGYGGDGRGSVARSGFGWTEVADSAWISRSFGTSDHYPLITSTTTTTTSFPFPYVSADG